MKNSFIKINTDFVLTNDIGLITNFWHLNPTIPLIKPFNEIYNEDNSKDKVNSSKVMWCIFFNNDPDEELNIYYKIPIEEREEMLKEVFYPEMDFEKYSKHQEAYRNLCLTSVQKDLLLEKEALHKRAIFLRDTDYTLDTYETMTIGNRFQRVTLPGTAKQLDSMKKATESIMKNFERIEEKYFESKRGEARIFGGRKESATEQKRL